MANLYADKQWAAFRERVIELDGGVCIECGRGRPDGVVLQVHHKQYISGRKPWQYDYSDCETLCRGCHAREHGEIRPDSGWEYVGEDDLGDLAGNCELCGTAIRYVHYVLHEHWEQMGVGTNCCDALTGTWEATEARRRLGRLRRFLSSSKWKVEAGRYSIKYRSVELTIVLEPACCKLIVDNVQGKKRYKDVLHAKEFAFDFIDSGQAAEYAERRRLRSQPPPRTSVNL